MCLYKQIGGLHPWTEEERGDDYHRMGLEVFNVDLSPRLPLEHKVSGVKLPFFCHIIIVLLLFLYYDFS